MWWSNSTFYPLCGLLNNSYCSVFDVDSCSTLSWYLSKSCKKIHNFFSECWLLLLNWLLHAGFMYYSVQVSFFPSWIILFCVSQISSTLSSSWAPYLLWFAFAFSTALILYYLQILSHILCFFSWSLIHALNITGISTSSAF